MKYIAMLCFFFSISCFGADVKEDKSSIRPSFQHIQAYANISKKLRKLCGNLGGMEMNALIADAKKAYNKGYYQFGNGVVEISYLSVFMSSLKMKNSCEKYKSGLVLESNFDIYSNEAMGLLKDPKADAAQMRKKLWSSQK